MHLELFPPFPSLLLFLLAFAVLSLLLLLRRSQNDVLSEDVGSQHTSSSSLRSLASFSFFSRSSSPCLFCLCGGVGVTSRWKRWGLQHTSSSCFRSLASFSRFSRSNSICLVCEVVRTVLCRKRSGSRRTSNSSLRSLASFSCFSRSSAFRFLSLCDGVRPTSHQKG